MATNRYVEKVLASQTTRRRFLQVAGLGAGGLATGLVLSCEEKTPASTGGTTGTGTAGSPVAAQPVRGGTLTVVQSADIVPSVMVNGLNPANYYIQPNIFETLTTYRTDRLEAEPQLAESWKFTEDYRGLTLKLRPGVKYHTGRAFTSADVKWNLERGADPKVAFQAMVMCQWVQKIDTPDPLTVTITFDKPRPSFLDVFEILYMADPQTHQDSLDGKQFVGTGPFRFKEWMPGDHISMVRNPDYWRKDRPYLDEVTVKVIPEPQTELINLQTGSTDVAHNLERRDLKELANDKNYKLFSYPVMPGVFYMGLDTKVPAFADKRGRQAMGYLIDRKRILDTHLFFGQAASLPWDKSSPAYDANLAGRLAYDPNKAKDLLAQVGVAAGTSLTLYPAWASAPETMQMAEIFQADLAKVGLKGVIEKLPQAEGVQRLRAGTYNGAWLGSVGYMHMTPSTMFVMAQPYRLPNGSNFDTPEYRKLIDDVTAATDEATLKKIYTQLNEYLLDQAFLLPIASVDRPVAASNKVNDLRFTRGSLVLLADTWKSR